MNTVPDPLRRILGSKPPIYATDHLVDASRTCGAGHPRSASKVCGAPLKHSGEHSWVIRTERED